MSYCVVSCAPRQISVVPKIGYTRGGQLYEVRLPHLQEATQARAMHVSVKWNIGYNAANCLRKWLVLFISDSTTATNPLTTTTTTTTKTSFPYRLVSCSCSSDCFGHYTSPFFRKKKIRLDTVTQVHNIYFAHHSYMFRLPQRCHRKAVQRTIQSKNVYMNNVCFKTLIILLCLEHYAWAPNVYPVFIHNVYIYITIIKLIIYVSTTLFNKT